MKALLEYTHDIKGGTLLAISRQPFICGDEGAHEIRLTVMENGIAANLDDASCQAMCVLSNRATAAQSATKTGNIISVTFPATFYAIAGDTYVLLRLSKSGLKYDVLCLKYNITAGITSTVYDPSGELPDLTDFQDAIAAANAAADAANAGETLRASAETARASAESARLTAEQGRVTAEGARASAETSRASAETARASAETARASAESARLTAEQGRVTTEGARASAETSRASAETARASAESARVTVEQGRVTAEAERAAAEAQRAALGFSVANGELCVTYEEA